MAFFENNQNLPYYEIEYQTAKRKRKWTKTIGRLISAMFIPIVAIFDPPASVYGMYVLYWTIGTAIRVGLRVKQNDRLKKAFLTKAAYEEGMALCDNFVFDPQGGLPVNTIQNSGMLIANRFTTAQLTLEQLFGSFFNIAQHSNSNEEYMAGTYRNVPFERATVDLYPEYGREFCVNWMVFRLPVNTMTAIRYMSGQFANRSFQAGFQGTPLYQDILGGLYHVAGEQPTEYLKDGILALAASIGDECEIMVYGNQLHVLVKRAGYSAKLASRVATFSEQQIRTQAAGRISEITQCVDTMEAVFAKGIDCEEMVREEPSPQKEQRGEQQPGY